LKHGENPGGFKIRKLAFGLLAATGIALAMPANAQDVYIGAGPVGVGVDVDNHRDRDWRRHYDRDDTVVVRERSRHCRVTIIHEGGFTKKIRRCD
jgi:hypothetical protein